MTKTSLVIVDELRYDTAVAEFGYLAASVEGELARIWKLQSCLLTISAHLMRSSISGWRLSSLEYWATKA